MTNVCHYWSTGLTTLYHADAGAMPLADGSVHMVVTSPPYYGTRTYAGVEGRTWPDGWQGVLGLEPTIQGYVEHIVGVFREVRRVLRDDGTLWLNLGVTYAGGGRGAGESPTQTSNRGSATVDRMECEMDQGQLIGIPWRVALALQNDGWFLRSEIIWHKQSPMPESLTGWAWHRCRVKGAPYWGPGNPHPKTLGAPNWSRTGHVAKWTDCSGCPKCAPNAGYVLRKGSWRPTEAHEQVFLFSKRMQYYCDGEAGRQPMGANLRSVWPDIAQASNTRAQCLQCGIILPQKRKRCPRCRGNAWNKHYAVFPEDLPKRCILAGTSEAGVCAGCGMPWARVIEATPEYRARLDSTKSAWYPNVHRDRYGNSRDIVPDYRTLGWRPCCGCNAPAVPATVLDPFAGTATTLVAAQRLGRRSIGCDLSKDYLALAQARLEAVPMPLKRGTGI